MLILSLLAAVMVLGWVLFIRLPAPPVSPSVPTPYERKVDRTLTRLLTSVQTAGGAGEWKR